MKLVNFYEVRDEKGETEWGGADYRQAVEWFRRSLGNSICVSVWNEESEEDFKLITDSIDITCILLATILNEKERV